MTSSPTGARPTGRPPQPQRIDGELVVDLDGYRARYDCRRPGCSKPLEGPVTAARHGMDELHAFITDVKSVHLAAFHKENDR